jgi:cytochrome bd-type quinol oxidase subunit 1
VTAVTEDRAEHLEEAVGRLRLRQLPAERLERWVLVTGAVLIPVGVVVILAGWWGAARAPFVVDQIPYLISGGFLGLALALTGALLFFGYWLTRLVREGRAHAREQTALLHDIRDALVERRGR